MDGKLEEAAAKLESLIQAKNKKLDFIIIHYSLLITHYSLTQNPVQTMI